MVVRTGTAGNNTLDGTAAADTLSGLGGNDVLRGLGGNDILIGGTGYDTLSGGTGADIFRFTSLDGSRDRITDFSVGQHDGVDLHTLVPNLRPGGPVANFVRVTATASGTTIDVDPSGSGANFRPVALLAGVNVANPVLASPNPVPQAIAKSGLTVGLDDIAQVPLTRPAGSNDRYASLSVMQDPDDGTGRLFVNDARGLIYILDHGVLDPTPLLDVRAALGAAFIPEPFQMGLRSFALHPDFNTVGKAGYHKLYTVTTQTTASAQAGVKVLDGNAPATAFHDVLTEWTISAANPDRVDPASRREILRLEEPRTDHNMDQLAFNPNAKPGQADYGKLYIGTGDGGNTPPTPDLYSDAQDPHSGHGKILRIDPLDPAGTARYSVPGDNPFVQNTAYLPEIWALGLRHPERFSWDTGGTGKMIIADIGEAWIEELDLGVKGANYGWATREGSFVADRQDENFLYLATRAQAGLTDPVAMYDHDGIAKAIIGGFVYRGDAIPGLVGQYVFGDLINGKVFYVPVASLVQGQQATIKELTLTQDGHAVTLLELVGDRPRADLRFGQDADGDLYILTKQDGWIREIVPNGTGQSAAEPASLQVADHAHGSGDHYFV